MYTPHPLPTFAPGSAPQNTWFQVVDQLWQRIITMLQSVPVVPNSSGLFDQQGNWLPPVISAFDVIVAMLFAIMSVSFILRLSGGHGVLTGFLKFGRSQNEK